MAKINIAVMVMQTMRISELLLRIFRGDRVKAEKWLFEPNEILEGREPLTLLKNGDGDKLIRVLNEALERKS